MAIYVVKQACGNEIMPSVYLFFHNPEIFSSQNLWCPAVIGLFCTICTMHNGVKNFVTNNNITDNLYAKKGNLGLKSAVYDQEGFQIKSGL